MLLKLSWSIITAIVFPFIMYASYQIEHNCPFDETMRYEFMQEDNFIAQYSHDYFNGLPFQPLLQGLLDGSHPYQLLLIDSDATSSYIVIKSTGSYVYLIGNPNADQLNTIIEELSNYKNLVLICEETFQSYFVQHGFKVQARIEFTYIGNAPFVKDLPEGLTVQRLDLKLFKQSSWFNFLSSMHGGAQRFLEYGFGFALVNQDGVSVAQAYGAFLGNGLCEIGVITHPDHRGKGYIMYPAQALIDECVKRNLQPVWSCNSENTASLKIALKLGFKIKKHYIFLKNA